MPAEGLPLTSRVRIVGEANLDEAEDPSTQGASADAVLRVPYLGRSGARDVHQVLTGSQG